MKFNLRKQSQLTEKMLEKLRDDNLDALIEHEFNKDRSGEDRTLTEHMLNENRDKDQDQILPEGRFERKEKEYDNANIRELDQILIERNKDAKEETPKVEKVEKRELDTVKNPTDIGFTKIDNNVTYNYASIKYANSFNKVSQIDEELGKIIKVAFKDGLSAKDIANITQLKKQKSRMVLAQVEPGDFFQKDEKKYHNALLRFGKPISAKVSKNLEVLGWKENGSEIVDKIIEYANKSTQGQEVNIDDQSNKLFNQGAISSAIKLAENSLKSGKVDFNESSLYVKTANDDSISSIATYDSKKLLASLGESIIGKNVESVKKAMVDFINKSRKAFVEAATRNIILSAMESEVQEKTAEQIESARFWSQDQGKEKGSE
ncbi:MAG: hypothetical protein AABY32_02680 [Nanoarchaeota archaeon]